MGGRGASFGGGGGNSKISLSQAQERKLEDNAQFQDAKHFGYTRGAKTVEYTDRNGKTRKAETGRTNGGVYRAQFSEQTANYSKMSTSELQQELKRQKEISDTSYQKFTRKAASKSGSLVSDFSSADVKIKQIQQILRRRKTKG